MLALNIWGSGRLLIPLDMGRDAHHGLAMWSATRRRATIARRLAGICLKTVGPRLFPGRRVEVRWLEMVGPDEWEEITGSIEALIGPYEHVISYRPPQQGRSGLAFLLVGSGRPVAFVKIRERCNQGFERETLILEALEGGTESLWTPTVIASGTTATWRYVATDPLPSERHMPCFSLPNSDIINWYQTVISHVLGDATTENYLPMHGDFAPWNVRTLPDGRIAILDWEDADWGPPGADLAYLNAAGRALGRSRVAKAETSAATDFWRRRLMERSPADKRDKVLKTRMLTALSKG